MTRTSTRHVKPYNKSRKHHYRPKVIKISDLRKKPVVTPPRVIFVTNPFYERMEYGEKTVESRPNYPCLRDIVPGTVLEFKNRTTDFTDCKMVVFGIFLCVWLTPSLSMHVKSM